MKINIILAAMLAIAPTAALAQTTAAEGETPAVATPEDANPTAPVAGENSFTEAQVIERLTEAGFTNLGSLALDKDGVWRTTGMKDGKMASIAFDYQGNIAVK